MMFKVIVRFAMTACILSAINSDVYAQTNNYNSRKMANAIGPYLASINIMEIFQKSECGYVLQSQSQFDLNREIQRTMRLLSPNDRSSLKKYIDSERWRNELSENRRMVRDFIRLTKEKYDIRTACGLVSGHLFKKTGKAIEKFKITSKKYGY